MAQYSFETDLPGRIFKSLQSTQISWARGVRPSLGNGANPGWKEIRSKNHGQRNMFRISEWKGSSL